MLYLVFLFIYFLRESSPWERSQEVTSAAGLESCALLIKRYRKLLFHSVGHMKVEVQFITVCDVAMILVVMFLFYLLQPYSLRVYIMCFVAFGE